MTLLILGSGLVGGHLASQLVAQGEEVQLADLEPQPDALAPLLPLRKVKLHRLDALKLSELVEVVRQGGINRIVHTVAIIMPRDRPYYAALVNCLTTLNVLEVARIFDLDRIVFTSSFTVYRSWSEGWWEERKLWDEENPLDPSNLYAGSKGAADLLGIGYHRSYGIDFISLRYPFIFGPWKGRTGGTFSSYLLELMRIAKEGVEKEVEPAFQAEEFIYVKDVASSLIKALEVKEVRRRVMNVGTGRLFTFEELLGAIGDLIPGSRLRAKGEAPRKGFKGFALRRSPSSIALVEEELGFRPSFGLREALADYLASCEEMGLL